DDGQPEPGPAELARSGLVDAIEALGDPRKIGRWDSDASVDDVDLDVALGRLLDADRHAAALGRVLDGVVDQIQQDLNEPIAVGEHQRQIARQLALEPDLVALALA